MEPVLGQESGVVAAALTVWRRKATNVLLAVAAVAHLPPAVLVLLGHGPPMGWLVKWTGLTGYLIIAAAALSRGIDYRIRLWTALAAGYLSIAVLYVALPHGPYARVGGITMPVSALVLLGAQASRLAVLACITTVASAPFLRSLPVVSRTFSIDPASAGPPGLVWMQSAALIAFLAGLVFLLDRFHRFLVDTLAAQEREATERAAAQRKVANEMRERKRLEREVTAIGDAERRRLGQELHDGVCQQVTAVLLRCQSLERRFGRGGTLSGADFGALSSLLGEAIDEARRVALGLCPLEPEPEALAPALRALAKRTGEIGGVHCEFLAEGDVRAPDPNMAQHLYRIAQEALSNAVRHARASRITVELRGSEGELVLRVEDDGVGLPAERPAGGMGLRTMAYRAQMMEGELTVSPAPGGGACVAFRVPRAAGAPAPPARAGEQPWVPVP